MKAVRLKNLRYLIGIMVSLVLLVWALRRIDWSCMVKALRQANYVLLFFAALVMLGMFILRALRWKILLDPLRNIGLRTLWSSVLIGYFGNFALTANAGEFIRAYILGKREGLNKSVILATIVVEKMLDVLFLLTLLSIISVTLALPAWIKLAGITVGLIFIGAALALIFLSNLERSILNWIGALLDRISISLTKKIRYLLHSFIIGLQLGLRKRGIIYAVLLSCLIWPLLAVAFSLIGEALRLSIPRQAYFLLVTLITLGTIIPALPGHVGTLEFLIISCLAIFSVDKEWALTFTILLRLVRLLPLSLGYVGLVREGLKLSDIRSIHVNTSIMEKQP